MKNISRCIMVILTLAFLQNTQAQTGNVGVGTTTPPARLSVQGVHSDPLVPGVTSVGVLRVGPNPGEGIDIGKTGAEPYAAWIQVGYNGTDKDPLAIQPLGGYVGIGTMAPKAPLHIVGASGPTSPTLIKYFSHTSTSSIQSAPDWAGSAALFVEGNVCATEAFISSGSFNFSDARIKNIIGRSDAGADLDRLNRIEITRYTLKDDAMNGNAVQTKVIAQQLETVMPEAVSYIKNFIPDVMQLAASQTFDVSQNTLTLQLAKPHNLKPGDRIRCIEETGKELIVNVLATPDETSIEFPASNIEHPASTKLFVYGKEVNDFHVVDYDAIAMLNVSATQEQQRLIEDLQKENAAQREELNDLYSRLGRLEAALSSNLMFNQNTASK